MIYVVRINDKEYEVEVEKGEASIVKTTAVIEEESSKQEISAASDSVKASSSDVHSAASGNEDIIKAPIPGTVLDIKAHQGTRVKKGDILLILEAMKMENEIVAPKDGVVTDVLVTKGSTVDTNEQLIAIA